MQGFIESLIGEVDAMEKQMILEQTNLFESSYELDNVEIIYDDDDFDIDLEEDDDDLDSIMLDESCCSDLKEDDDDLTRLDEMATPKPLKSVIKTQKDKKIVEKILECLEEAESNNFIDKYSTSLDELMDSSYEILEFRFDEDEIEKIPEKLIQSTFWSWMA